MSAMGTPPAGVGRDDPGNGPSVGREPDDHRHEAPLPLRVAAAWSWRVLAILALGYVLFIALVRVQVVVLPVILTLLLCTFLYPVVSRLERARVPRGLGAIGVVVGALAAIGGAGYVVYRQVRQDAGALGDDIQAGVADVERWLVEGPLAIDQARIDAFVDRGYDLAAGAVTGQRAVGGAVLAGEIVAGLALTVVLLFFFLKDGERMWGWLVQRAGHRARPHVAEAGERAWWALGGYMRGQAIVAAADAVFIGIGIIVLGVPFAIPLIALTFFGAFFPIVGAVVAGSVAVLVALADGGLTTALILLAVVIGVQQLEGNVLEPVVMSRTVRLHPVIILVALGAGAAISGLVGAFLAVPLAAATVAVGSYMWAHLGPADQPPEPAGGRPSGGAP